MVYVYVCTMTRYPLLVTGEGEGVAGTDSSTVMFDQLMLADLKDKVKRVNSK